ncbi:multicopper oxidase domain-containing protein [Alicyclobacillus contaminans]|uniref:multicopper oxidase domain-containing protein n=1 Tax=Alicyclobacillus contaminans TaxID=392016 RepID=UPI00146F992C|nr:multicopper oxidase domain-containing protein [Alicyclobacillus contaminans]
MDSPSRRRGGQALPTPISRTTVAVAPLQTVDIQFTADNPGHWCLHSANPHCVAGDGRALGGMVAALRYVDSVDAVDVERAE